jgi:toxin-antitoxin system PIN domain toxin
MRCVDVNLLVYAHRPEADRHEEYRAWLEDAADGDQPLGLIDAVMAAFVRVVTHPGIYRVPTPLPAALSFVAALREAEASIRITPGERHWEIFEDLCLRTEAKGNAVPDAFLAAIAIENRAVWLSADRGFARFPGLDWKHPLDG